MTGKIPTPPKFCPRCLQHGIVEVVGRGWRCQICDEHDLLAENSVHVHNPTIPPTNVETNESEPAMTETILTNPQARNVQGRTTHVWAFYTPDGELLEAYMTETIDYDSDLPPMCNIHIRDSKGIEGYASVDMTQPAPLIESMPKALEALHEARKPPPPRAARTGRRSRRCGP